MITIKKNSIDLSARLSNNVLIARSKVGMNSYIACNVVIVNAEIGNYCSIAPGVQIGGMEQFSLVVEFLYFFK